MNNKNELRRESSSAIDSYLYRDGTIWPNISLSQSTNYGDGILPISDIQNNLNQPFEPSTGQWRVLNLKVDPQNGYGDSINGVVLKFGFASDNNSSPMSAACGFTLGIPPLHARHISTVSRCIAYGFIVNAIAPNPTSAKILSVQHGNNLINLGSNYNITELEIQIINGRVIYKSGGQIVSEQSLLTTTPILYAVGILGHQGNKIINTSYSGGASHSLQAPNYGSEVYIPCFGLGENRTKIELKLNSVATITYPDGGTAQLSSNPNTWQVINPRTFGQDIPLTIKVSIDGGLANLSGIKITDPLRGLGSSTNIQAITETSLSRAESRSALSNLKELDIRGSSSLNSFLYHIGELPIPALTSVESQLEIASMEGSFDASQAPNLVRHQKLKQLNLTQFSQSNLSGKVQPGSATRLEKLVLSVEVARNLAPNSLINFRQLFHPNRSSQTHGFAVKTRERDVTWFNNTQTDSSRQPFREWQNIRELAIAAESAKLLYGDNWVATSAKQNKDYIELSGEGSLREVTQSLNDTNRHITGGQFLVNPNFTVPNSNPSSLYGTNPPNRVVRVFYISSISNISGTSNILATVRTNGFNFTPQVNKFFFLGTMISNTNTKLDLGKYYLYRKITSVTEAEVIVPLEDLDGNDYNFNYRDYTLTLSAVRSPVTVNNLAVTINPNQPNTFTVTVPQVDADKIHIGDTVWMGANIASNLEYLGSTEYPAMVIDKQGTVITILQGSNDKHPAIAASSSTTLHFAYEFSRELAPIPSDFISALAPSQPYVFELNNLATNFIRLYVNDSAQQAFLRSYKAT